MKDEAAPEQIPEIPVRFYRTATGREPVLDRLRKLDKEDRQVIGFDLMHVQFGSPIGMPLVRSLGDGLWEVRSDLRSDRIARWRCCFKESVVVVLHGFIKKTQKTSTGDLAIARRRMKEVIR